MDNVAKVKHKIKELDIEDYSSKILYIINDSAAKYKGIIPDDCWHEPYMPKTELENEFKNGVRMFGYLHDNELIGVIGFQEIKDVVLIRHAYTLTQHQGKGKGSVEYWVAQIQPGKMLYEMEGVPEELAREAFQLAAAKLPIKTTFVARTLL